MTQLTEEQIAALNPGIRSTVLKLREWGFDTRDSGDGKTHQFECDLPIPFVHIMASSPNFVWNEMESLRVRLSDEYGIDVGMSNEEGDVPAIEGFIPANGQAFISLYNVIIPE
jgi:hypothetical protein